MIGLGIDTGGTCTDSVLFDFDTSRILASAKSPTTHENLEVGIGNAIDALPADIVKKTGILALSTTLATNAAVEHKGGRVLLIFLGANEKVVRDNFPEYGFEGTDFMMFFPADACHNQPPEWEEFARRVKEVIKGYDSVAISQMSAQENDGAYEHKAAEIIRSISQLPVICAYDLFHDRNVIRRAVGAYLNARLLPIIQRFLAAIHRAMDRRNITAPIIIMRSDGSVMSEDYASEHPVETLLCGPAASTQGGIFLERQNKAAIVDMGGTTTDIILVKEGSPIRAESGVLVGDWRTFVKGLDIDTFALGGDSEVLYHDDMLSLSERRVIPISHLAASYPVVLDNLRMLGEEQYPYGHPVPLYTHFCLLRSIDENAGYSAFQKKLCRCLENGPQSILYVAEETGKDVYSLNTEQLEREGVILRSAFTPTDAMILQGDMTMFPAEAALLCSSFIERSISGKRSDIPNIVYEMVRHKLYGNIVRILLKNRYAGDRGYTFSREVEHMVESCYQLAAESEALLSSERMIQPVFQTDAVLVGVGAPTYLFLPRVAEMLGTTCCIPKNSGVANALGALIGNVKEVYSVEIKAIYTMDEEMGTDGFMVYAGDRPQTFSDYGEAVAFAEAVARSAAEKRVLARGAVEILRTETEEIKDSFSLGGHPMLLSSRIQAEAVGTMYFHS